VEDIDIARSTITIQHLKMCMRLSCPHCGTGLGRSHTYCPKCGANVQDAVALEKKHRRVRTLPIDPVTLAMLRDYISRGGPVSKNGNRLIFGIKGIVAGRSSGIVPKGPGYPSLLIRRPVKPAMLVRTDYAMPLRSMR